MRGTPRDARNYELMTVLSPDVPEDEIQSTTERVTAYVTSAGGQVVDVSRESPWGRRRLAYPIRHAGRDVRDGFYTLYHFQAQPHRIEDIERELKLNDRVMRYLLTQYTPRPVVEEPAAEVPATDAEPAAEAVPVAEAVTAAEAPPAAEVAEATDTQEPEVTAESPQTASTDVASADVGDEDAAAEEADPTEEA